MPGAVTRFSDLYDAFALWCDDSGQAVPHKREVARALPEKFAQGNGTGNVKLVGNLALGAVTEEIDPTPWVSVKGRLRRLGWDSVPPQVAKVVPGPRKRKSKAA